MIDKTKLQEIPASPKLTVSNASSDFESISNSSSNLSANKQYWFLLMNPSEYAVDKLPVGSTFECPLRNKNGQKRGVFQCFLDAKIGEDVIVYASGRTMKVVALAKIFKAQDGKTLVFKKMHRFEKPLPFKELRKCPKLDDKQRDIMFHGNKLVRLTEEQYDSILNMISQELPEPAPDPSDTYGEDKFLEEVYISGADYKNLVNILKLKKNVILQGPPGVGKTFAAKRLAYAMMGKKDESCIKLIQFHQNYSYEDFIMGYKPNGSGFELRRGVFYNFCLEARNHPDKKYFFIIDEINRGNLSKIFGELFMLVEASYRGTSAALAYTDEDFSIPENLYLIGMMNTADRSLAMVDYALRRRFSFFDMKPCFECDKESDLPRAFTEMKKKLDKENCREIFDRLIECIKELNKKIDESLGKGFSIGHSYFCDAPNHADTAKDLKDWLGMVIDYDIVPMLREYWFDDIKDEKANDWGKKLHAALTGKKIESAEAKPDAEAAPDAPTEGTQS